MARINVPLQAPGTVITQAQASGQSFVKGLEDIRSSRQAYRAKEMALQETQKDIDSGLTELVRQNQVTQAELDGIELNSLKKIYNENPQAAEQIALSGVNKQVANASNELTEAQNTQLVDWSNKLESGLLSYEEVRQKANELFPEQANFTLPENEDQGKAALKLFTNYAPEAVEFRRKLQLKQKAEGQTKYKAGFVQGPGGEQYEARQIESGPNTGRTEVVDPSSGQWRDRKEGENFFTAGQGAPNKAASVSNKRYLKTIRSPEYSKEFITLEEGLRNARLADEISQATLSGAGAQTLVQIGSTTKTLLTAAGFDQLAAQIDITNEETLRASAQVALRPAIEAQGRSFSDTDRKNELQAVPGLQTTPEINQLLARRQIIQIKNKQEEKFFEAKIAELIEDNLRNSPGAYKKNFQDYLNDFPRSKLVNGKFTIIEDSADLFKYYVNGRPKAWVFETGHTFTMDQLKQAAEEKGLTIREAMAQAERQGLIRSTVH